ncbi:MAG: hypothetical protein JO227_19915, partial [Acetobacteraceae bacterium]|nr:hypothetical protein [Acetobacteraceae bacterium]
TDSTGSIEIGTAGRASAGAVTMDTGATLATGVAVNTITGNVVNNGTLSIANDGYLTINGSLSGAGQVQIENGASLLVTGGASTPSLGAGSLTVNLGQGSSLWVWGATDAGNTIAFTGSYGQLILHANPDAYFDDAATLTGFDQTDTIRLQVGTVTGAVYTAGSQPGTGSLALFNGNTQVGTLAVAGDYTGETFLVTPVANSTQAQISLFPGDVVVQGNTVTVTPFNGQSVSGDSLLTNPNLVQNGVIQTLIVDRYGAIAFSRNATINDLEVNDGARVVLNGATVTAQSVTVGANGNINGYGTLSGDITDNGNVTADGGTLVIANDVLSTGTLGIRSGSTLDLQGTISASNSIDCSAGNESLLLGPAAAVNATINGWTTGDTIGFENQSVASVSYDSSNHLLTLTGSSGETARLLIGGSYTSYNFAVQNGAVAAEFPAVLSIAATDADKPRGHPGETTPFTFTVTRTGDTSVAPSVHWAVTAPDPTGFVGGVAPSGTLTFAAGETSKTITVDVFGDSTVHADEGFTVSLSSPSSGAVVGNASASGTIRNDEAALYIAATDADKGDGQPGATTPFTFTVTRSGDTSVAHTVHWAVTGSGANPATAADFVGDVLPSGTVSFAPGQTRQTITVNVAGDNTVEPDEGFTVSLSAPSIGAVIGTAAASGTIRNDDASLSIAATDADKPEGQAGSTTPFTFTVTRSGDTSVAHSVHWAVTGSGANPATAADFVGDVLPSGTVTFAAGESTQTITVNVAGGNTVQSDEGFTVSLSSPSAGAVVGTGSASGTIQSGAISVVDTSSGEPVAATVQAYTGPVAGLQEQYIAISPSSLNISVNTDNWFIHSGSGEDAIAVHGGTNVLDGGTGSNFLVGASGSDTFFIDDRGASADIWSTLVNFHAGDACTLWGVDQSFTLDWEDNQGAAGYTGLTLHAMEAGTPIASMTLAGYTKADLDSGRISIAFGSDPASGSNYLYVHANS